MGSAASKTWYIALVVVTDGERFVLVHEKKNRGWYLPAGRVDPGETLKQGAVREVLEESGLEVELDGIIRFEFTPALSERDARLRVVFVAHVVSGSIKTVADEESLGAAWVRPEDLGQYRLRAPEVIKFFDHVARRGPIAPLSMLTWEGAPL